MVCEWGNYGIIIDGSVAEWLKAHDSKSCGRVNRLEGSNPFASAIFLDMNMTPFYGGLLISSRRGIPRG